MENQQEPTKSYTIKVPANIDLSRSVPFLIGAAAPLAVLYTSGPEQAKLIGQLFTDLKTELIYILVAFLAATFKSQQAPVSSQEEAPKVEVNKISGAVYCQAKLDQFEKEFPGYTTTVTWDTTKNIVVAHRGPNERRIDDGV